MGDSTVKTFDVVEFRKAARGEARPPSTPPIRASIDYSRLRATRPPVWKQKASRIRFKVGSEVNVFSVGRGPS
jgi:hypothetical protein